jgi:hypothetical protein
MTDELLIALGRLEGKVDALLNLQRMQEEKLKEHDERLRKLEDHKHYVIGVATVIGGAVSMAIALIARMIK